MNARLVLTSWYQMHLGVSCILKKLTKYKNHLGGWDRNRMSTCFMGPINIIYDHPNRSFGGLLSSSNIK